MGVKGYLSSLIQLYLIHLTNIPLRHYKIKPKTMCEQAYIFRKKKKA